MVESSPLEVFKKRDMAGLHGGGGVLMVGLNDLSSLFQV